LVLVTIFSSTGFPPATDFPSVTSFVFVVLSLAISLALQAIELENNFQIKKILHSAWVTVSIEIYLQHILYLRLNKSQVYIKQLVASTISVLKGFGNVSRLQTIRGTYCM